MGAPRQKTVTGCIGCRLRRKKCDEARPQCLGCARNGILCVFPEPGNEEHARLLRRTNCPRRQPVKPPLESKYSSSSSARIDEPPSPAMFRPAQCITPASPYLRQPASQRLLHHYVHRTSKAMATCRDMKSPFLTELIPVAMANDELVLNAILACSGIHLAALSGSAVDSTTWVHYGQAVQSQKFALTRLVQGNIDSLVSATIAAILLCIAETFVAGAGKQGMNHLKAVQIMMRQIVELPQEKLSNGIRTFLIERVSYMITLAHVSMDTTFDQSILDDTTILFSRIRSMPIVEGNISSGCVHDLFWMIPRVSAVARRGSNEIRSAAQYSSETITEYQSLLYLISSWNPTGNDEIYNSCGKVYQQALLAYIASVFEHPASPVQYPFRVQDAFDRMTELLDSAALDAPLATTLCWPLAVFGACAKSRAHHTFIDAKLVMLAKAFASQSIRDTRDLLLRLWSSTTPRCYNPLELERFMRQESITILFL